MSIAGSGLIGLSVMFSLNAVSRVELFGGSAARASNGSVSDLCIRARSAGILVPPEASREWECLRVDMAGDGRRVDGRKPEGSLECDLEEIKGADFFARVGRGRLLNVLLLGMPPIGSSGRQM